MKLQTTYPSNNYPIYVEHGAIKYIGTYLNQFDQSFLLIDEYVNQYFANKFDDILSYENVHKVIIPAGEKTKTFEQYQETLEYILSHHVTRNTAIIAVGGGATGDFAGFVAATLLRGVHFIQVPQRFWRMILVLAVKWVLTQSKVKPYRCILSSNCCDL